MKFRLLKLVRVAVLTMALVSASAVAAEYGSGMPALSGAASSPEALANFSPTLGYSLVASDGGVFPFGGARFYGSTGAMALNKPVVAMAATPGGKGYWLVASDGGVFPFGDAQFYGSTSAMALNKPVVAMAAAPDGKGYWLVASDGGVFRFGDAQFYGSTGAMALNKPVVAVAATPDGKGYWLVASDGGVFPFGDAQFYGSTSAMALNKPVVAMAATPDGKGYWLVASDGGVFPFGDAQFYGSTSAMALNKPVVAMAATPDGKGYWLVASDGEVFTFGDAQFYGSAGAMALNKPVVAMSVSAANSAPVNYASGPPVPTSDPSGQSIAYTSTPPKPAVVGGTYTVTASGGASGNPVTFSIDASAKGSCTISGATVTFVAVGTCVIDANQAGNANYEAATQLQQSFAVVGTQSIAYTSTPPTSEVVGGTYTVTASGGASGNPVTFSIDASSNGSCTISGSTVTFVAVGTCVIDANQAGNANYEAAAEVQQSVDPDPGTQSITFTSTPPTSEVVGGTYTVTASGGASGNPVTFSADASSNGSCTISGATVTFVAVGTCVIDANQAGNANYEAAAEVQQSVDPDPGTQSITFTSTPPTSEVVGGTYTVTASGGASGNPVTFSVDASSNGSCTISGATVTFVAVGTCVIDANQAGNANYEAATEVQQSVDPEPLTQSIAFTSTPPSPALVGGTYTVTASGGASGNPVTFSIDASAKGSCTISGATVTFGAVGTCVIDANQAGNANYEAATQLQQSFTVVGTQSIAYTSTPPKPAVVGGTYTVTASGGASGNPVTFSIDASAKGSCTISGATVTFGAVGTCVIDANQAGNANYEAATQLQQSFTVVGTQSIAYTSTPPKPAVVGGTYTVTASGGASGNPVTFSIDASAKGSCTISGATVTFGAVGTCVIDANQAGNANYEAATQLQQSFTVVGTQSIAYTSTPPTSEVVGGTYTVTASGGASGNPVTFSIDASSNGSCTISGATVTFVAVGTCVIDANQAGNANYEAATQVQQSFAVAASSSPQTWACTSSEPQYYEGSWETWTGSTCPQNGYGFAADPVDFVGMNDPTDQLGENSEVDADFWSPVCATSSGSIVGLNDPACVTRETQVIDANSAQDWQVTVNSPTDPTGQVTTYPNARAHGYGGTVDSYTSLTQTMSVSMPNVANVSAHAMPDDYLSQPGDSNFDYEIMIQWDRVNDAPCGSSWGGAKYTVASVTTSGGSSTKAVLQMTSAPTWQQAGTNDSGDVDLYDATNDSAEPGIYSVSGSTVTLQTGTTTISPGDVLQGFQGWGVSAKDIMIDGSPWLLCDSQPPEGRGTNGGCVIAGADEGCGALVWKPAPANNPTASDSTALDDTCDGGPQASPCTETIDLKAMFTWLETHDPPNSPYPYVEAGSSIQALTSGFEIMSTGGGYEQPTSPAAPATFASHKFTICADCG